MFRNCDRPGCGDPSVATLGYDQRARTVWLDDVDDELDPHAYDLCRRHADALSVPLGWALRDRRRGVQTHLRVVAG